MGVIFKNDQVFQFIGYTKDQKFDLSSYDDQFLQIIKSLRSIEKDEKLLSKPLRLSSYKVVKGDNYKVLASKSSININAEDQLRLINGDYPDKKLEIGRIIKIVK
jgi:predicted Zn-dependent protease